MSKSSKSFSAVVQAGMIALICGLVLFACEKSSVTPADADATAARKTIQTDSTGVPKDSTCHKDSLRHGGHGHGHGFPLDSVHICPPKDSLGHGNPKDSTGHHPRPRKRKH